MFIDQTMTSRIAAKRSSLSEIVTTSALVIKYIGGRTISGINERDM